MSQYTHVSCSRCGVKVSNTFIADELVIRAFIECGACIEKQPDYETRIKEYEQEAVFLRERHIALQAELQASEIRFQEERARILQIIEKEKHWVEYDFQPDIEDTPNSVGAWICERIAEEIESNVTTLAIIAKAKGRGEKIETYPHLTCLSNTENKQVNENDGDWRDVAYRGEDY